MQRPTARSSRSRWSAPESSSLPRQDGRGRNVAVAVHTSAEPTHRRGGHPRATAAAGVLAALVAATLPWSAPALVRAADAPPPVHQVVDPVTVSLPAFVIESAVTIAREPRPERAAAAGPPVRLVVPALHVDVPVVPIGAPDGVLLPPSNPQVLGWWRDGAVPGAALGGALVTGHTVHTGGGALDHLRTLQRGDRVVVHTTKGRLAYTVTGVTNYRKATLAHDAQRVFSQSVPGRLVLITCADWNGRVYLSNTVVFAERT